MPSLTTALCGAGLGVLGGLLVATIINTLTAFSLAAHTAPKIVVASTSALGATLFGIFANKRNVEEVTRINEIKSVSNAWQPS